uniref:Polygalacturonase n=1 Tax=Vitis vinifera TaxID=29760 RepID=F6HXC5_VITVI
MALIFPTQLTFTFMTLPLELKSAVQISDVSFTGFWGTSATDDAIKLSCIETVGCANITVDDISIKSASGNGETYSCINAHGTVNKTFPPLT